MAELWSSLALLMAIFTFIRTFIPVDQLLKLSTKALARHFSSYCYYQIPELDGVTTNELYTATQLYLSSSASVSATSLSLTRSPNSSSFTFNLTNNDHLLDVFNGVTISWEHQVTPRQSQSFSWRPISDEKRCFTLRTNKKDKLLVLPAYLDHIMDTAADLRRKNKDRFLYTNRGSSWECVRFKHPSTFNTLAMDPVLKDEIIADLGEFRRAKTLFESTGRAWKRGYLLHGPPGTGKSSMIAAMANHLGYDIYDLELTQVQNNSDLRTLLMNTTSKSIVVIEDIDCSADLANRVSRARVEKVAGENGAVMTSSVTLSGLLNFTDGLWSCCGSERIFVFTTNYVEKLDPALLRSGRMDMKILMSYCSFPALKILVSNYLSSANDHDDEEEEEEGKKRLWMELEEVIGEAEMTPADVSEVLIKNRRWGWRRAMEELVVVVKRRAEERKMSAAGVEEEKRELELHNTAHQTLMSMDQAAAAADDGVKEQKGLDL